MLPHKYRCKCLDRKEGRSVVLWSLSGSNSTGKSLLHNYRYRHWDRKAGRSVGLQEL